MTLLPKIDTTIFERKVALGRRRVPISGFTRTKGGKIAIVEPFQANRAVNPNKRVRVNLRQKIKTTNPIKSKVELPTEPINNKKIDIKLKPDTTAQKSDIKLTQKDGKLSFLTKKYKDISPDIFNSIIKSDPTTVLKDDGSIKKVGQYSDWIMRGYDKLKYPNALAGKGRFLEDIPAITDSLKTFHEYNKMLPSELKNIDNIQSFTDLHKISLSLEKYKRADQSKSGKDRERFQDIDSNINKLLDTPTEGVDIPQSEDASKFLDGYEYKGTSTKWCTGGDTANMYNHYNEQGDLYVITTKNKQGTWDKHQLHFESGQFKDSTDRELTVDERNTFFNNHKDVKNVILNELINKYLKKGNDDNNYDKFIKYSEKLGVDFNNTDGINKIENRDNILKDLDSKLERYHSSTNTDKDHLYGVITPDKYLKLYSLIAKDKMKEKPDKFTEILNKEIKKINTNINVLNPNISTDFDRGRMEKAFSDLNTYTGIAHDINPEYLSANKEQLVPLLNSVKKGLQKVKRFDINSFASYVNSMKKIDPTQFDNVTKNFGLFLDAKTTVLNTKVITPDIININKFMDTVKSVNGGVKYLKDTDIKDEIDTIFKDKKKPPVEPFKTFDAPCRCDHPIKCNFYDKCMKDEK